MQRAMTSKVEDTIRNEGSDDLSSLVRGPEPAESPWELGVLEKVAEVENSVRDELRGQ